MDIILCMERDKKTTMHAKAIKLREKPDISYARTQHTHTVVAPVQQCVPLKDFCRLIDRIPEQQGIMGYPTACTSVSLNFYISSFSLSLLPFFLPLIT